jgi:hypothetical protein
MKKITTLSLILITGFIATGLFAQETFRDLVGNVKVGPSRDITQVQVPFIVWGGDVATFYANGGLKTQPGTIFNKLGLNINLIPGDDFIQQVLLERD